MDPTASNNTILEETKKPPFAEVLQLKIKQRWQTLLDRMAPQLVLRWIVLAILFGIYFVRVYYLQGFYIITYALGIFMLNLFIGFLSPVHDVDGDGPMLPVNDADEFKPFVRRLPEFKFW